MRDLTRSPIDTHNPAPPGYPNSCEPCELDAHLSPNGGLLAYRYRPDAPWPPERVSGNFDEWWVETQEVPGQVTVVDLTTGRTLFTQRVAANTRLVDFDGRFLAIGVIDGIGASPHTTTILDTRGQVPEVEVAGNLSLIKTLPQGL